MTSKATKRQKQPGAGDYVRTIATSAQSGDLEKAVRLAEKATRLFPAEPLVWNALGGAKAAQARAKGAPPKLKDKASGKALPEFAARRAIRVQALDALAKACGLASDFVPALFNRGLVLAELGRHAEAAEVFRRVTELDAKHVPALHRLALALRATGDRAGAEHALCAALDLAPEQAVLHLAMSSVRPYTADDPHLSEIKSQLQSAAVADQSLLSFALGKAFSDIGETSVAFEHFARGNAMHRSQIGYDPRSDEALFRMIKARLRDLPQKPVCTLTGPRPVFIVGMPRSGTTLIEQILAQHSEIEAAGELECLNLAMRDLLGSDPTLTDTPPDRALTRAAMDYQMSVASLGLQAPVFTDKMPVNFRWLGFILTQMPEAKVVHMVRDARATCWSSYRRMYPGSDNGFAYDLKDLAAYYGLYRSLMAFWHDLFPGRILDVEYESLTVSPEAEARRLFEYIDLPWEDACLDFQASGRSVETSSVLQVRQPIYTGSSEDWRAFEPHLGEMTGRLLGI